MRLWSVGPTANEIRLNSDVNFTKISLFGQLFGFGHVRIFDLVRLFVQAKPVGGAPLDLLKNLGL